MVARLEGVVEAIDQITNSTFRSPDLANSRCELLWRIHDRFPHLNHTQIAMQVGLDRSTVSYWLGKHYCKVGGIHSMMAAEEKRKKAEAEAARQAEMVRRFYHSSINPKARPAWNDVDRGMTLERIEKENTVRQRLIEKNERDRRVMAMVPADTRSITGRLCGDPLPGRSALDQRRNAA